MVGSGYGGQPVAISVSPPAYVIRQQAGLGLPTSPNRIFEALGGTLIGAGITAALTALMPANEQIFGPIVSGALGTVAAVASPIGTWPQEMGGGAMSSAAFALFLKLTNQMPGV